MKKIDSIDEFNRLFNNVDYILTDCDGVCFLQDYVIPGSNVFLNKMRKLGKKVIYATNNSTKSRRNIIEKLHNLQFEANDDDVMVTSYAAGLYLKKLNFDKKVYVFGSNGIGEEFKLLNINFTGLGPDELHNSKQSIDYSKFILDDSIEAVVLGFDYDLSYAKLTRASSYAARVKSELFIASNFDSTVPTPYPHLTVPGTGSLIRCISSAVGKEPVSMGKPGKFFFDCIKQIHQNIDPKRTVMIGDRLDTDIAFASNNNLGYSLFVQSGVSTMDDIKNAIDNGKNHLVPTHFIEDLGKLNQYLKM